jgi:hypothetical protein
MQATRFWRDASQRMTFDIADVSATAYPTVCRAIVDAFALTEDAEIIIGPDQTFWEWRRGEQIIGLDWDIWMGFMAVAKSAASEALVEEVATWLSENPSVWEKPEKGTE